MREVMVEAPQIGWDDIGGLDEPRDRLREGVELPLKHPEAFRRLGIRPAKGFLLYGPPGTGKTLLAKAAARESQANFIATKSSDLLSKWYGESEQQIARLFARARQVAPTIIFIDELDSLVPARGGGLRRAAGHRARGQHHPRRDGRARGAAERRGDRRHQPADPDRSGAASSGPVRRADLCRHSGYRRAAPDSRDPHPDMPLADDVDLESLAKRTERFTGADLEDLVRRAGLTALRRGLDAGKVTMADFETALGETRASVTPEMLEEYDRIQETLKSEATRPMGGIGFVLPGMLRPKAGRQGKQLAGRFRAFRGNWRNMRILSAGRATQNLPTAGAFANGRGFPARLDGAAMPTSPARTLKGPRRLHAPARSALAEPAVAVPARFPEASGDGRIDHPVEPGADRQDAPAGRLGQYQAVRRIWAGRRHLHPADLLDRMAPDATLVTIDTNSDFTKYLTQVDRRSAADRGHRLGRRRRADPHRARASARPITCCRACPSRPCRRASATRSPRRPPRSSGRAARSWSISSAPRCCDFIKPHFERIDRGFEWINVPPATLFWAWREPGSDD